MVVEIYCKTWTRGAVVAVVAASARGGRGRRTRGGRGRGTRGGGGGVVVTVAHAAGGQDGEARQTTVVVARLPKDGIGTAFMTLSRQTTVVVALTTHGTIISEGDVAVVISEKECSPTTPTCPTQNYSKQGPARACKKFWMTSKGLPVLVRNFG